VTTPADSNGSADPTPTEALASLAASLDARHDELDQFARTAAHDLHAPLRSIEAFTRLAIEADDRTESTEHLERVLNAVGRMRRLLDSLLELAGSGQAVLDVAMVSLNDVAHSAVADLARDIEDSEAIIDIGPLPAVEGDSTQLQRVFTNLFSNAIRYAGDRPPKVEVRAVDQPDEVVITVSDRGDGFSPEHTEAVFQPFRRLSTNRDGQGIGLAICRRIVERHGGTIWAESEPGTGTTISLILPRGAGR
jgi:signal transduction histidine kinase